ncbi:hypothetical protein ACEWY4_016424 [Coilia grayii]|uniref:HAT C-terminal dimerisation domain-containing protein n=1 Tax=Coilia grayii TaxID=363190 RepID=A0ABD1JKB4_9TELE
MVVKDSQPFSVVEDEGFRAFAHKLDPTYVLPTRQALKAMVAEKYAKAKEEAKACVLKATAVSLTADMWTSINMDAYLAVTCHFLNDSNELKTIVLGVQHFPQAHTAAHLAAAKAAIMEEWGIRHKVTCLVTDAASNMIAAGRELNLKHGVCIGHTINLMVKKALDQTRGLQELRNRARKVVNLFRCSTTAKERLVQIQVQLGRPTLKLIKEVETRWNSTFLMFERMYGEREPLSAAMSSLQTDVTPLTSAEFAVVEECLGVLSPFNEATVELSTEKKVSASKIIPLMKMLDYTIGEQIPQKKTTMAKELAEHLFRQVREKLNQFQIMSIFTLPTLLDPRFKTLGFLSPSKADEAVQRLTSECTYIISSHTPRPPATQPPTAGEDAGPSTSTGNLWRHLDVTVQQSRQSHNSTADGIVEVQRYIQEAHIPRKENPLTYWNTHKSLYPNLFILAQRFSCIPASSVPCERVFSKAGEVVSKKRNRLSPKAVEQILFLNKYN